MEQLTILTWAVGILAALVVAMLAAIINISYQLRHLNGQLTVLINHAQFK
jgi:hypothetical protein